MSTLADVAELLRSARKDAGLSQAELAERAGVSRTTLARMETLARGDMSVSALVRLLGAAGHDLKVGIAKQMVCAWDDGMASLRSARGDSKHRGLRAEIEAARFSDPAPPERPEVIGRSELLRKPNKRK